MKLFSIVMDQVLCATPLCFAEVRTLTASDQLHQAAGSPQETVFCVLAGELQIMVQRTAQSRLRLTLNATQGAQIPAGLEWTARSLTPNTRLLRVDSPHPTFNPQQRLLEPLREVHRFNVAQGEQLIYDDHVRGAVLTFAPGFAAEKHFHQDADELFWFFQGTARVSTPEGEVIAPAGTLVYSPAGEWHIIANAGETPLLMFLTVTPNLVPSHTFFRPDGTPYARSLEPLRQPG
jgi:mannose-6-phosphate isomerase-like protein (cupin superfamily)